MSLYHVTVTQTREATFWVKADSREAAQQDADILADGYSEWDEVEDQVWVSPAIGVPPKEGTPIWTGGPDGGWEFMEGET